MRFVQKLLVATAGVAAVGLAAPARAHIDLTNPPMRFEYTDGAQKTGPCGGGVTTGMITGFVGGDDVTVTWDETVPHSGHFRVSLDTDQNGADDFPNPSSENDMTVQGNIIAFVPDPGGASFSHTFNLPDINCNPCSLQVIQVMTGGNLGDGFDTGYNSNDIYSWCADITITSSEGAGGGNPATTGAGGSSSGQGGASEGGASEGGSSSASGNNAGPGYNFPQEDSDGSCAVRAPGRRGGAAWLLAAAALLLARRRR